MPPKAKGWKKKKRKKVLDAEYSRWFSNFKEPDHILLAPTDGIDTSASIPDQNQDKHHAGTTLPERIPNKKDENGNAALAKG